MRRVPLVVDTGGTAGVFALPAGTVTLLVAEVESSAPAVAGSARDVVAAAVAAHDGVPWPDADAAGRTIGVFARASDGVAAAGDAQRALLAAVGPDVRLAVHTGEARSLADAGGVLSNDLGSVLLGALRLSACAHGGQVLLAGTTADLAAEGLTDGTRFVDLGVMRLRDLVRYERVFQLAHDDLPDEFPPLRSLDSAPNTLPTPVTSLLGRDDELITVRRELAEHRCVTLTGAGGVGKTRLAQQVAADLVDRHPGGTWWVELAACTSAQAVIATVAEGVQLALRPRPEPLQQVVAHLGRSAPVLLVLDNCEHVVDPVAELVHHVLAVCPAVSILATSRERLDIPGERVWRVASLRAPLGDEVMTVERLNVFDAVTLFVERARQVRPNFVVDDRSAPHVAAICCRLDGIPLAIELAAAWTRSLSVDRVSAGLDDVFHLLTGGPRVAVPRQQTLLASITWSYDLLIEADQAVLRRLSICPAWFDVDAAEAVGAAGGVASIEVLDCLTRLVDKNLVDYDDPSGRYRILETIRQFGLERLADSGEGPRRAVGTPTIGRRTRCPSAACETIAMTRSPSAPR